MFRKNDEVEAKQEMESWDEYLASDEYINGLVPEHEVSEEEKQRNRSVGWFSHSTAFWDWRLQ